MQKINPPHIERIAFGRHRDMRRMSMIHARVARNQAAAIEFDGKGNLYTDRVLLRIVCFEVHIPDCGPYPVTDR